MLTSTLRKGTELSASEKGDIIVNMFLPGSKEERDSMRESLVRKYGITEGTITSLIAHETMRRMKKGEGIQSGAINTVLTEGECGDENPTQVVQESTQFRVYAITTLSELTEGMREDILEEFGDVIRSSVSDSMYDYYLDIEAISDYYNIDPSILEQFLRNRYNWLGAKLDELKKGKILTEEDKLNIRIYVSEGVDDKDKKTRRKEMAQKYGVSTYVIGAITAWKIDANGEKILKKDNKIDILVVPNAEIEPALETQQSINDSQIEHNLTITDEDEQNDSENSEGEHTSPEIEVDYIKELALEFNLQDNEQRGAFLQHVFELFPDSNIDDIKKIIPDFPDDENNANKKRGGEGMGTLMEYDNEIKNKWRQKLKEFIDENTDIDKRKEMKVICLPGIQCYEIPLYLELGFNPDNIIGVEAGEVNLKNLKPDTIDQIKEYAKILGIPFELTKSCIREILTKMFQKNATKYGIQTRIGMLDKVLETEETVFDVVSLDFLGPVNNNAYHILESIKYAYKSIVLTNFQGKREWKQQDILRHFESKHDGGGRMVQQGGISFIVEGENSGIELKQTRDGLAIGAFIANATSQLWDVGDYGIYGENISQIISSVRGHFLKNSLEGIPKEINFKAMRLFMMNESYRLAVALTDTLPYKPKDEIVGRMQVFIRSILIGVNFVIQHKSYEYKGNNVPMLSDMLMLEGLDLNMFDKEYPELTSFIMKILIYVFSTEGIREINFQNIKPGKMRKNWKTIVCGKGGKVVAVTSHLKFMTELWKFGEWYTEKNIFASKREQIL